MKINLNYDFTRHMNNLRSDLYSEMEVSRWKYITALAKKDFLGMFLSIKILINFFIMLITH